MTKNATYDTQVCSNENLRYSNWAKSVDQSESFQDEECTIITTASVDSIANNLYNWYPQPCISDVAMPICQYEVGETCPKGWTRHEDRCYEFFINPEYWRSWRESRLFCDTIGAELATLKSVDDQNYISSHNSRLVKAGVQDRVYEVRKTLD